MDEKSNFYLSYSKIATYLKCPLRYKFIYVDNLPTEVKPYFSLGNSIHKVLEKFYSPEENFLVKKKEPFKYLMELLETYWISEGYSSKEEEEKAKEEAKEMLVSYYRKNIFGFAPAFQVESEFSVPFYGISLKGRFDRIDKTDLGFIIVDYKTNNFLNGSFKEEEILQPVIYKLAGEYVYGNIIRVSFYYLRKGQTIDFEVHQDLIEKSKRKISGVVENIFKGYFPPNVNGFCASCEFKDRCEAYILSKLPSKTL